MEEKNRPNIELKVNDVVVNVSDIKEFKDLMEICELSGDLKWGTGDLPIEGSIPEGRMKIYGKETCINFNEGQYLSFGDTKLYKKFESFEKFCKMNNITQKKLSEINNYFI